MLLQISSEFWNNNFFFFWIASGIVPVPVLNPSSYSVNTLPFFFKFLLAFCEKYVLRFNSHA